MIVENYALAPIAEQKLFSSRIIEDIWWLDISMGDAYLVNLLQTLAELFALQLNDYLVYYPCNFFKNPGNIFLPTNVH